MRTLHLVDRELRPMVEVMPTLSLTEENLPTARAGRLVLDPAPTTGSVLSRRSVPGPPGAPAVPLHVYRPAGAAGDGAAGDGAATESLPGILHLHGGGYVLRSAADFEPVHRRLVAGLRCVLISVDYRLAPETIFPGALEDCYAALRWTFEHAAELGIDPRRIGVMGESAGGGLAAALALLVRDRGVYQLAFQHLTYPMLDDRTCVRDPNPATGEFIWNRASNHFGWRSLLGREPGGDDVSPYAAAARAADLSDLPPAFVLTGALDLFVDEDIAYASRLVRAGVPTELHVHPGAIHGFDLYTGAGIAARANAERSAALKRALDRPVPS